MYLTEKQLNVLEFIREYRRRNRLSPTLDEMATHFGVSKMTVYDHVLALEEKGAITRAKNRARSIEVIEGLDGEPTFRLPLRGLIAAGTPVEAFETAEEVDLLSLVRGAGECFLLRVKGDSMIEDGILEGDLVIVEKRSDARSGQTVVALLDSGDVTLKKLYKEKDRYRLQPANPRIEPIVVKKLRVQGVVVGILRNLR